MKKHGIVIREHKHWNTKTIYNDGYLMMRYGHVPKTILFQSPMVSDLNQHLCGRWSMSDIDTEQTLIAQLTQQRKPFGTIYFRIHDEAVEMQNFLHQHGLVTTIQPREKSFFPFLACQPIRLSDIGDLDVLITDYRNARIDIAEEVNHYADWQLQDFFDGWDIDDVPKWLTGLILGYPIENTISLYLH